MLLKYLLWEKYSNYPLTTTLGVRFASCENIVSRFETSSLPTTPLPPLGAHQMSKHPRRPSGSQSGREKRREQSFHVRAKEPLGTDSHRTISKTSSGCRLLIGHKHALYYCAQSSNSFSLVLFVRSYTTEIVSSPFLSFTKLVAARETFYFLLS